MTTDWRTLPAGFPLDTLVAGRVMGWCYGENGGWRNADNSWAQPVSTFCPSTTGDGMLLVLAEMRGRGYVGRIVQADDGGWVVDYSILADDGTYRVLGRAEFGNVRDIPYAVCRAALAALERER